MNSLAVEIPISKNYWLIRTNGGKYYSEYRRDGFIGINWNEISAENIRNLNENDLKRMIKKSYPDKRMPSRASSQLRAFETKIKKGDTIVITGVASNKFSIGEVKDDNIYEANIDETMLEENPKLCTYRKRRKVEWVKEVNKMDVDRPMFQLLQHARNTVNNANEYADTIESLVHGFYNRGNESQLTIQVKKEADIPAIAFYSLNAELLELVKDFATEYDIKDVDVDKIITKVNMNSKGNFKLKGTVITMSVVTSMMLCVFISGGGGTFNVLGAELKMKTNPLIPQIIKYLDAKQEREQKALIMEKYIDQLEIKTPDEFKQIMSTLSDKAEKEEKEVTEGEVINNENKE